MTELRFRYQTLEFGNTDVHLCTLRDNQQYSDDDGIAHKLGISSATWPLFGIVWSSGEVLAHLMLEYEVNGLRILEVGCGIALASLVLNLRHANITATDYHPEVGHFLQKNVMLNHAAEIPFVRTDWSDKNTDLGKFDLIIGSDLLYERSHVDMLSTFIEQHAAAECSVIIVDPGRGHHACFSKKMLSLRYSHCQEKPENTEYLSQPFKGQILYYQRQH
jgi:ETFB lysine methyltransferase